MHTPFNHVGLMRRLKAALVLAALAHTLVLPLTQAQGQTCELRWSSTFIDGDIEGSVYDLAVFDDGGGPALFIGGAFSKAGGLPVSNIIKWDGARWIPVGDGVPGPVSALKVFDHGSGPALYAGGNQPLRRWDGRAWTVVAGGPNNINALEVFDSGSGPELYVGGQFSVAGTVAAFNLARWNGSQWNLVGGGVTGVGALGVRAMAVFDDGGGPDLYVGGKWTFSGVLTSNGIVRWDGQAFSLVGTGGVVGGAIDCMAVYDDGSGPDLYVGGTFHTIGGSMTGHLAKWSGSSWSSVGAGIHAGTEVNTLAVHDTANGPVLVAGGFFTVAGTTPANHIATWDGLTWSALQQGVGAFGGGMVPVVEAALTVRNGGEARLFVGGNFQTVGPRHARSIASWDDSEWRPLGNHANDEVRALALFDDGVSGPQLYATGAFTAIGGVVAARIARWDGVSWHPLGSGLDKGDGAALAVYDEGDGPSLFVGGGFNTAGGVSSPGIARWDGSQWTAVASGVAGDVLALVVHDWGDGPQLVAGGQFFLPELRGVDNIARWNGSRWSALGSIEPNGLIRELAVGPGTRGQVLYAGGSFISCGALTVNHVAMWDGKTWSSLDDGVDDDVQALFTSNLFGRETVYVGGQFQHVAGELSPGIGGWQLGGWTPLNKGIAGDVFALTEFASGSGPVLIAGGTFSGAGDVASQGIALWNGSEWHSLPKEQMLIKDEDGIRAMLPIDIQGMSQLYVAGSVHTADGLVARNIARLDCVPVGEPADFDGDGDVDGFDLALLLGQWTGAATYAPCPSAVQADLNDDCKINGFDLAILLAAWG